MYVPYLTAEVTAEVAAAVAAVEAKARDSGMEDEEGEGSWKPATGAAPSTLGNIDRTCLGKESCWFIWQECVP